MFTHILKLTYRNILRHRSSFFINLVGLSTGLACSFLIYLWINDEVGFDKFHENSAQIYQIMESSEENDQIRVQESTQGLLAQTMAKELPEVEKAVNIMNLSKQGYKITLENDLKTSNSYGIFAENGFFDIFTFPLIEGTKNDALNEKEAIVLSEKVAIELFGSPEAAIGKPVKWALFGQNQTSRCTGVFEDLPQNSTLQFDYVLTGQKLLEDIWTNGQKWWNQGTNTYLLLNPKTDIAAFNKKIERFVDKYDEGNIFSLSVRPYSSVHLYDHYEEGKQEGGGIEYVKMFSIIAILVLVIAGVNFMNLSTARASRRLKEIGIKKAIGSTRKSLIFQFLVESITMSVLSCLLAILLIALAIPQFNFITGKELAFDFNSNTLLTLLGLSVMTGLFSGSYPAFYLSGFDPVATLKGRLKGKLGELFVRKGLVIFQFTISLVLIISVFIIRRQIHYAESKPSGYNKENVAYFNLDGRVFEKQETFIKDVGQIPGVKSTGLLSETLLSESGGSSTYGIGWPGDDPEKNIDFIVRSVNEGALKTLGIEMEEGKAFSKELGANENYLLFNETAIKTMGLKNPVGTKVVIWGEEKSILGVVKDFHTASLHKEIKPLVFRYSPNAMELGLVKIESGKEQAVLGEIESLYKSYNPGFVFTFNFFDEAYKAQYLTEVRVAKLSSYFAGLAILISCLGLLGLAAFNTEIRAKEIGVRKVLGASSLGIMRLLTFDFLKLVLISVFISVPISAYFMDGWLSQFVYKIGLEWWVFALAGCMALCIAMLTVGFLSFKTSIMNPVKSLKSE
ncbi:ABC transporter permease [Marinilongibacter aquaticus]|uniref:ABC transporter permease n=1 Tax=Marinilongibacter aquaticus TaxID=2975157 RepID=UPI0021BD5D46|nr:ABC transporter permease [Marinilongibacter aquaticus]UBM57298.1 ABC transporter permease [Marinilongibacter aquaticus]